MEYLVEIDGDIPDYLKEVEVFDDISQVKLHIEHALAELQDPNNNELTITVRVNI